MPRILPALFPTASTAVLADFGELFPFQLPAFLVGILVFYLLRNILRTVVAQHSSHWSFLRACAPCRPSIPGGFFCGTHSLDDLFLAFGLPPFSCSIILVPSRSVLRRGRTFPGQRRDRAFEQPMIRIGHRFAKASAKRRALMAVDRPARVSPAGE
jgi:hypothetical protein